jgi:uncharacterized protein Usg
VQWQASTRLAASGVECQHIVFIEKKFPCGTIEGLPCERRQGMSGHETELMLRGYGLTTAEMFYRLPDYRNVLNTFVWQDYDLAPDYPVLFKFIEFWQDKIEGPLHSVRFTHRKLIAPGEWRNVVGEFRLH